MPSDFKALACPRLPGRIEASAAAALLGFQPSHIPVLVASRLLRPLGSPPSNAPKYFAREYILELSNNQRWLARASDALVEHWASRNNRPAKVPYSSRRRNGRCEFNQEEGV
jgi:hypothetical protein